MTITDITDDAIFADSWYSLPVASTRSTTYQMGSHLYTTGSFSRGNGDRNSCLYNCGSGVIPGCKHLDYNHVTGECFFYESLPNTYEEDPNFTAFEITQPGKWKNLYKTTG